MKWCFSLPLTLLLLFFIAHPGRCYPNGAPRNRKVCKTLKPHHRGASAQTSSPPYSITPSKTKIPIGGSVNVTISAHPGESYKGFIMQARPRMIANVNYIKPIGTFKIIDAAHSQTLDCLSAVNNTVTHTNADDKTSTSFIWTPPAKYKGPAYFRASFVKDFNTFWVNVSSQIVVGDTESDLDGTWDDDDDLQEDSPVSENDSSNTVSSYPRTYEGCGIWKSCFGLPEHCVSRRSCNILATAAERGDKLELELLGKGVKLVIAFLSENGNLNLDSMSSCVFISDSVKLIQTTYTRGNVSYRLDENDSKHSYVDDVLHCKYLRDDLWEFNHVHLILQNREYFLFVVMGDVEDGKQIDKVYKLQRKISSTKKHLIDVAEFDASFGPGSVSDKKNWYQKVMVEWFLGLFDYFTMLR